jgi:AraC-like DNA-binding protein
MTIWFKSNKILNFYLVLTSFVLCYYLIAYGINHCKLFKGFLKLRNLNYYQVILILTPSVYLFFKDLIINYKYPMIKDLPYFALPILLTDYLSSGKFNHFFFEQYIVFILFILYTVFYCWKSNIILKRHILDNDNNNFLTPIVKNWADFIFKMMLLVLIHFYVFFISHFFNIISSFNLMIDASLLIVFLIGYFKVIFSPELLYGSNMIGKISNTATISKLVIQNVWVLELKVKIQSHKDLQIFNRIQDKVYVYIEQIEKVAFINYSFRKPNYSITELSTELGLPKYYLEFIFKYYCKISFNDYKKTVRIYDAAKLIDEGYLSTNTLDTLSRFVGFSSYNPFLINFKEILGISPFDYYKRRLIVRNKAIT